MGQQSILGKKSGRQKKPVLALPSDNSIYSPWSNLSLNWFTAIPTPNFLGRPIPTKMDYGGGGEKHGTLSSTQVSTMILDCVDRTPRVCTVVYKGRNLYFCWCTTWSIQGRILPFMISGTPCSVLFHFSSCPLGKSLPLNLDRIPGLVSQVPFEILIRSLIKHNVWTQGR